MLELSEKEFLLVLKMLKRLKSGRYTRYELSGVLDFSIYSTKFYKLPLFQKLKNEKVFQMVEKQSNVEIYRFDWDKLKKAFLKSNIMMEIQEAIRAELIEKLI